MHWVRFIQRFLISPYRGSVDLYLSVATVVGSFIALITLYSVISYRLCRRNIPGEIPSNQKDLVIRTARKVTILMISIVFVFFVSWTPAFAFHIILEFGNAGPTFGEVLTQYPLLFAISYWLICNNSAFNPLLYFIFIESFRQGLRTACSRCRVPRFSLQERRLKTGQELTRNRPTLDIINKEEGNIELKAYSGHNLWVGLSSFKYKTFVIYLCDHEQEYERRPLRLRITFECFPSAVLCKRK